MARTKDYPDAPVPVSKVAEIMGVNPQTVARWCAAGKIPAFKTPGGHYRIRQEDIPRRGSEQVDNEE